MKYKKASLLAIAAALALILCMATGFAASAVAMDAPKDSTLPDNSQMQVSEHKEANIATGITGFGTTDGSDSKYTSTDEAEIQIAQEPAFGKPTVDTVKSSEGEAALSTAGVSFSGEQSTKTSIAAQTKIFYTFGSGTNKTFYEKDTEIAFTIQCSHADIPLTVSLVPVGSVESVDSYRVETNEQTTIVLTVPSDGDYVISVRNESLSRTQEYSHVITR